MGWRLGGKCASGRDMAPDGHRRIKEHGLHMLMGCYQYAFFAIRACFDEWKPRADSPWKGFKDAFTEVHDVTLMEQDSKKTSYGWDSWKLQFIPPRLFGIPGEVAPSEPHQPEILSIRQLLTPFTQELFNFLRTSVFLQAEETDRVLDKLGFNPENAFSEVLKGIENTADASYGDALKWLRAIDTATRARYGPEGADAFWCPLEGTLSQGERRNFILANLGLCIVSGALLDVWPTDNEDSLNNLEFKSWLRRSLVCEISLDSAPIRVLYDLMFAYMDGDSLRASPIAPRLANGNVAAGVALRFVIEAVVGYRKAPLWKMNAGMGDTIFTPFYQVLKERKVDIKLFHRVTKIGLTPDESRVGTIEITQQAEFVNQDYSPFEPVRGLDCWPDRPRWNQLKNGSTLKAANVDFESAADKTVGKPLSLNFDADFDVVVLALPPEIIKLIATDLPDKSLEWRNALRRSRSVVTVSSQFWLADPVETLGGTTGAVVSAFEPQLSSWAEMSHVLDREDWPIAPKGLAYTCGCVAPPEGAWDPVQEADDWIRAHLWKLWPGVGQGNIFDPDLLVARYDRTNDDPSELYVQTPAGTVDSRLKPDQPYFDNLFVAGDWTRTRFSGGCLESAFESGIRAADAVREFFPSVSASATPPGK
jgi:uncharacterized protein with NAD-binding domain and iron-sulfur cluster